VRSDAGSERHGHDRGGSPVDSRRTLALVVVLAVVGLDQVTKVWAVAALADGPVSILGATVELALSRNTGGAFSVLSGLTPLLAVLAVVVAVVLVRVIRRSTDPILVLALALVLGGALGNLIDRLVRAPGFLRGAVIDFISIAAWPTFNVADSAITIGALSLVIWGWRRPEATEPGP
jgi:signal peptidase II